MGSPRGTAARDIGAGTGIDYFVPHRAGVYERNSHAVFFEVPRQGDARAVHRHLAHSVPILGAAQHTNPVSHSHAGWYLSIQATAGNVTAAVT